MFFSPIDPVWVALIVVVSFFVISGLCFCLIEAVKAGQKILIEQQESMSEEDRKHISKRKKRDEKEREKEKGEKANSKRKGNNEKEKEIAKNISLIKDLK
jgi:flagellar biosynthesis/type III secretory pathway M-ring protein FliF/YscJ